MKSMETKKNTDNVTLGDREYERVVSVWNQVMESLNREGNITYMRAFIKQSLLDAVNCLVGYHVVLVADYWYNKHLLLEEDLGEIILAVRAANRGRLCPDGCTEEELELAKKALVY